MFDYHGHRVWEALKGLGPMEELGRYTGQGPMIKKDPGQMSRVWRG